MSRRDEDGDALVTIAQFNYLAEAHLARSRLESEGIDCFLADENMVHANWLYANAIGGMRLQVRASDRASALAVLGQLADELHREHGAPGSTAGEAVDCPHCGGAEIYEQRFDRRLALWSQLGMALLGMMVAFVPFALPLFRRRMLCKSCGATWKLRRRSGS